MADGDEVRLSETSGRLKALQGHLLTRQVQYVLDLMVLVAAFMLAYSFRFEFRLDSFWLFNSTIQLPFVVLLQFAALAVFGVYSFVWRYIGMSEVQAFVKAIFWSGLVMVLIRLSFPEPVQHWRIPLSVILMDSVLAFGGTMGLRVVRRAAYERRETRKRTQAGPWRKRKPVLLVGAGRAGVMVIKEIRNRGDMGVWIEGFIDDDPGKQGAVIHGREVLGTTRDLARLCAEKNIDHVIITIAQASRREIRRIVEICEAVPVKARIIPGYYEIIGGTVEVSRIRDVQIEDLLGREPVQLDEAQVADFLAGKTVMVSGAGGSIGAELARQAARFDPARLLLVERAEFALFEVDRQLRATWPGLEIVPLVADVGDRVRMRSIFAALAPQVVLHAAAHKHVP